MVETVVTCWAANAVPLYMRSSNRALTQVMSREVGALTGLDCNNNNNN